MDWVSFSKKVQLYQRGFMGEPDEMRPGRGEFHEFPYACVCHMPDTSNNTKTEVGTRPQWSVQLRHW